MMKKFAFKESQVHISTIKAGDIVKHNNKEMTASNNDIKNCHFMGVSLFGDSYHLGYKPVTKIVYCEA